MSLCDFFACERSFSALSLRVSRFFAPIRNRAGFTLLAMIALASAAAAQTVGYSPVIETLGDPVNYPFTSPNGLAVDSNGNVYVADIGYGLTEITPNCASYTCMTTLGGFLTGFQDIYQTAVDSSGNVYVADSIFGEVKEMPPNCLSASCVTVLATGFTTNRGLGIALDNSGNIYIADPGQTSIKEIKPGCAALSCAIAVGGGLVEPQAVAVDSSGTVYASDEASGSTINNTHLIPPGCASASCIASLGGGYFGPRALGVDANGNLYAEAEVEGNSSLSLLEIPAHCTSAGCVNTLVRAVTNSAALAVDKSGNIYFGPTRNNVLSEILSVGGIAPPLPPNFGSVNVGGSSSLTLDFTFTAAGTINLPAVLTQGATGLDFTDAGTGSCTTNGTAHTYNSGDTCTVTVNFKPQHPGQRLGAVELLNSAGAIIATVDISGTGIGPQITFSPATQSTLGGEFGEPFGVAVDAGGNVYVSDISYKAVGKIPPGCASSSCVTAVGGGYTEPFSVAVDGSGNVYVADLGMSGNGSVYEMPANCSSVSCVMALGGGFIHPASVAVDGSGNVYVADFGISGSGMGGGVYEMPAGCVSASCVSALGVSFTAPDGVAVDSSGNIYVGDAGSGMGGGVYEMPAGCRSASCVTALGGGFGEPTGLTVDAGGDIYVADFRNKALYEMPAGCANQSCVTALGGNFTAPFSLALDGKGNIYVGDPLAGVSELNFATAPTLNFPSTVYGSTSAAQTVTVSNIGNAALSWAGFAYPTDFTAQNGTGACANSSTLASGADCLLPIEFYPQSGGSLSESITLTDNNLNVTGARQTITVNGTATPAPQTITFPPPVSGTVNIGGSAALTATSTSGLPVGYLSRTPSICSVSGSISSSWRVSFNATGECSIEAYQWGNANYLQAPFAFQSFYVHGQQQTVTLTPITGTVTVGDEPNISATASSTLAVSFTTKTPATCAVSYIFGFPFLSANAKGSCTIIATQPGNSTYAAAAPVTTTLLIHGQSQSITFPALPSGLEVGSAFVTLNATASSGLPVSYASTRPAYCTVTEFAGVWTVNLLKAGGCSIVAEQSGNSTYASATSVNQNFYINAAR